MKHLEHKLEKELLQISAGRLRHVVTLMSRCNSLTNYWMSSLNVHTLLLNCNSPPDYGTRQDNFNYNSKSLHKYYLRSKLILS